MLWKSEDEVTRMVADPAARESISHELADIAIYVLLPADATGIKMGSAIRNKLALNAKKYPVDRARRSAAKYNRV